APRLHGGEEDGEVGHGAQVAGRDDETVPVAAEGDAVLAADVHHVPEVADDGLGRTLTEEPGVEHDPHHSPGGGDGPDLVVVDVAPHVVHAPHAGVGHDGGRRPVVHRQRVPETGPVHVGQVDHDAAG